MAGAEVDRLLLPGGDGAAVSHLRRRLQDPPERIHARRPIRHGVRFPFHRRRHRDDRRRSPAAAAQKIQMVTTLAMPEPVAPPAAPRPVSVAPAAPVNPAARAIIEIDDVDFNYGPARTLHDVTLNIKERE